MEKAIIGLLLLVSAVSADINLGCYLDKSDRLLDGQSTSSSDMTIQKCSDYCRKGGYRYAGVQYSSQCFCGNDMDKSGYGKKPDSECSATCSGDNTQTCGGTWRMNIYQLIPDINLGCYLDKSDRLLDGQSTSSTDMTIQKCSDFCRKGGYRYAGVQYSSQCFCGNDMDKSGYGKKPDAECSATCSGDNTQTCGGTWRMNIYQLIPDINLGCYLDKSDRLLDGQSTSSSDMTIQKCSDFCRKGGYRYAGVQYSSQCFCGNDMDKSGYGKKPDAECSATCSGDNTQTCGGTWRMNIYQLIPDINLGCYLDKSDRLLDGQSTSSSDMTIQKCSDFCRKGGYRYAGVQYSSQCFCGNDMDKSGYGKKPDAECSATCSGDNTQTCGGTWRMNIYQLIPDINLGCYLDKSDRLLDGQSTSSSDMTIQKCSDFCRKGGYRYAGVQYSSQCFCGNDMDKSGYGKKPDAECSATCSGDNTQTCGGTWRMNIYQLIPDINLGCYLDKSDRLLDGQSTSSSDMTIQKCSDFCRKGGYRYAGVQYSSQCFCGNDMDKSGYGKKPDAECSATCSGDNTQTCGGTWRMNIYQLIPDINLGCYLDKSDRLLDGQSTSSSDMTIQKCSDFCRKGGYRYAGVQYSSQCFCGNDMDKSGYGKKPDAECSATCSGDNTQTCGGTWRMNIYQLIPDINLGCYLDKSDRLLDGQSTSSSDMTIQKCSDYCRKGGYRYAGVQYSSQCFCGNDMDKSGYGKKPDAECSATCSGDNTQTCGGTWRMNIYQLMSDINLGCYLDKSDRLLDGQSTSSSDMTIQKCSDYCRKGGYRYAGVQYSSQCFCGNDMDKSGYGKKPDAECSATCSGDNTQTCGGTWRMNIYQLIPDINLGCYLDKSDRLLDGQSTSSSDMTIQKCSDYCRKGGYRYAGVQYSSQCFCGNDMDKSGYGKKPDAECSATCSGDNTQTCGGTWRMNIYQLIPDINLGCYLDKSDRLLEGQSTSSSDMTIQKCSDYCRKGGYRYAGVQYSSQCYCGNDMDKSGYGKKPESECSATCSGDETQKCGGTWRMNIYQIKPDIYLGCYLDKRKRLLDGVSIKGSDMTIQKCSDYCRKAGYRYAGVQYFRYCFCGNDMEQKCYGKKPETECSAPCSGDDSQTCGGKWRMNIYQVKLDVYLGCYLDKYNRLLDGRSTSSNDMTLRKCSDFCRQCGYIYAGLEYATQCYCGNKIDKSGYGKQPESECSATCSGDKSQTCGGTWRLSVYQTNVEYMACYLDKSERLLEAHFSSDATMTIEKCLGICAEQGNKYSGVQYATQCFCGDEIDKAGYGIQPESECNKNCGGDSNQKCGGTWRMNVYRMNLYRTNECVYIGCYLDKKDRLLEDKFINSKKMTNDVCLKKCANSGSLYAGTQYSSQCFCGDFVDKNGYGQRSELECSANCSGDNCQTCGGTWRMSVYLTDVVEYKGCYVDKPDRLLDGKFISHNQMTIGRCIKLCNDGSFLYAGLQYASQCFCGNELFKYGYDKKPDSVCSTPCNGNQDQFCGGTWRMNVYRTKISYRGCYKDKPQRLLDGSSTSSDDMSIEKCLSYCTVEDYLYAGLQYRTQCFCGNDYTKPGYGKRRKSECNTKCAGNENEKCGGTWRISIYKSKANSYKGCYLDKPERLLDGKFVSLKAMTIQRCKKICKKANFTYAGVQYAKQCFCGNNKDKTGYGTVSESECATPCSGNADQICGGTWRMSIYKIYM